MGYGLLAIGAWSASSRAPDVPAAALEKIGLALVLVLHGVALAWSLHGPGPGLRLNLALALSSTMWLGMLVFWLESLVIRIDGLRLILLPLAAVAALTPLLMPEARPIPHLGTIWLPVHLALSLAAYGLMTIAAMHALLMAAADRRLHRPGPPAENTPGAGRAWHRAFDAMPPLLMLEQVLFRLIGMGFVLLTLAMVSGIAMSLTLSGSPFPFDHKTLFTLLSWVTFGVLLAGRGLRGWRGRIALRYTITGFVLLMLAYAGSRFVIEVLLT